MPIIDTTSTLIANAGTPLMLAGCGMLFVGNVGLGILEAWLIRFRRAEAIKTCAWMIAANYASMLLGIGLVRLTQPWLEEAKRDPFERVFPAVTAMWVLAFVVTVLVEWPFVARTGGTKCGFRSLLLSLVIQAATYALIIPLSLSLGSLSAITDLRQVSVPQVPTVPGWLYFLAPDRLSVTRVRLDGSKTERVATLPSPGHASWSRIAIEPTSNGDRARLMLRELNRNFEILKKVGEADQAAPVERDPATKLALIGNYTFGPYATRDFRSSPVLYCGYWAREGIRVEAKRYALETPFLAIAWRSPIVLPDGKVVAQFGDLLMLIDPAAGTVAKLAEGSGGDVLLDQPHAKLIKSK